MGRLFALILSLLINYLLVYTLGQFLSLKKQKENFKLIKVYVLKERRKKIAKEEDFLELMEREAEELIFKRGKERVKRINFTLTKGGIRTENGSELIFVPKLGEVLVEEFPSPAEFEILVSKGGKVERVRLLKRSGEPLLDEILTDFLKKLKFVRSNRLRRFRITFYFSPSLK